MAESPSLISFVTRQGINVTLPVTPQTIEVNDGNNIQTFSLMTVGEVAQIKEEKVKRIMFESWFPSYLGSYVNGANHLQVGRNGLERIDLRTPQEWVDLFDQIKSEPVWLFISFPQIIGNYLIESFNPRVIGGHGRDIHYSMNLVEFKQARIRSFNFTGLDQPAETSFFSPPIPNQRTHQINTGETLIDVSRRYNIPVAALKYFNNITDSTKEIYPGKVIIISAEGALDKVRSSATQSQNPRPGGRYRLDRSPDEFPIYIAPPAN